MGLGKLCSHCCCSVKLTRTGTTKAAVLTRSLHRYVNLSFRHNLRLQNTKGYTLINKLRKPDSNAGIDKIIFRDTDLACNKSTNCNIGHKGACCRSLPEKVRTTGSCIESCSPSPTHSLSNSLKLLLLHRDCGSHLHNSTLPSSQFSQASSTRFLITNRTIHGLSGHDCQIRLFSSIQRYPAQCSSNPNNSEYSKMFSSIASYPDIDSHSRPKFSSLFVGNHSWRASSHMCGTPNNNGGSLKSSSTLNCSLNTTPPSLMNESAGCCYTSEPIFDENKEDFVNGPFCTDYASSAENRNPEMLKLVQHSPFLDDVCKSSSPNPISSALYQCEDISSLLKALDEHQEVLNIDNVGVAVAKIRLLCWPQFSIDVRLVKHNCIKHMRHHHLLPRLLGIIEQNYLTLTDEKIVCLLVHFNNLGISISSNALLNMFQHVMSRLQNFDLTSIARLICFLRNPDLNYATKGKFAPYICGFSENCDNPRDLVILNAMISRSRSLLSQSFLKQHVQRIDDMLDLGMLTLKDINTLVNILQFCSDDEIYSSHCNKMINRICKLLASRTEPFEIFDLLDTGDICRKYKQDRNLMSKIRSQALQELQSGKIKDPCTLVRLFSILPGPVAIDHRQEMIPLLRTIIQSPSFLKHLSIVFYILRSNNFQDITLLNEFWDKIISAAKVSLDKEHITNSLLRDTVIAGVSMRYLFFSNNLGGTYRVPDIESTILSHINIELNNLAGMVIDRFIRMAAFMIAYVGQENLPHMVVSKLQQHSERLNVKNLVLLTSGIERSMAFKQPTHSLKFMEQIMSLMPAYRAAIIRLAKSSQSIEELTRLTWASNVYDKVCLSYSRLALTGRPLYNPLPKPTFEWPSPYSKEDDTIQSRSNTRINNSSENNGNTTGAVNRQNFSELPSPLDGLRSLMQVTPYVTSCKEPISASSIGMLCATYRHAGLSDSQLFDSMLHYCVRESSSVMGQVAAQALYCAFANGHHTELSSSLLCRLSNAIAHDVKVMNGQTVLGAVLALCLYQALTLPLIKSIFNINYMDHLDQEIQACYSKRSYPARLNRLLGEVNRSVCLEYPEARVPWFKGEYFHDKIQTMSYPERGFEEQVQETLSAVLGGDSMFCNNTHSPYYYHIDLEFELDERGRSVLSKSRESVDSVLQPRGPANIKHKPGYSKYCVLLQNRSDFVLLNKNPHQFPNDPYLQQENTAHDGDGLSCVSLDQLQHQLKGQHQLKQRHLEILGYNVISIPKHEWQSMSLTTQSSKIEYLKRKIWPK